MQPGDYRDYNRATPLLPYIDPDNGQQIEFELPETSVAPGTLQLHHPYGLLINAKCYHGHRLPSGSQEISPAWNGKSTRWWELYMVKNHGGELLPIVRCCACRQTYRAPWAAVLPHIRDEELRARLTDLAVEKV